MGADFLSAFKRKKITCLVWYFVSLNCSEVAYAYALISRLSCTASCQLTFNISHSALDDGFRRIMPVTVTEQKFIDVRRIISKCVFIPHSPLKVMSLYLQIISLWNNFYTSPFSILGFETPRCIFYKRGARFRCLYKKHSTST